MDATESTPTPTPTLTLTLAITGVGEYLIGTTPVGYLFGPIGADEVRECYSDHCLSDAVAAVAATLTPEQADELWLSIDHYRDVEAMGAAILAEQGGQDFLVGSRDPARTGEIAEEWVDEGFTPETAEPWWRNGGFDASQCAALRDEGVIPRPEISDEIYRRCNYDAD